MAVFSAAFAFADQNPTKQTLATVTAGAEIVIGHDSYVAISSDADYHIDFGPAGMGAPSAANFYVPAKLVTIFNTGSQGSLRIFNPTAGNGNYYIQVLTQC